MAEPFNPYHVWLGIPPQEQPANRYRLLSVPLFESNPDVIDNAADQRTAHLRTFQSSKNAQLAERLLNEVAAARVCLLDPKKRAAYDQKLRAMLAAQSPAPAAALPVAASLPVAAPLAGDGWNELLDDAGRKPHKASGQSAKPGATRQGAKRLPIPWFVAAGVLLIAAIGIGVYAFTGSVADGALAFDWPADARAGATLTVDGVAVPIPASGAWEYYCPPGEHRVVAVRPRFKPMEIKVTVASGEQQTVAADWKPQAVLVLDWRLNDRRGAELSVNGRVRALSDRERFELPLEPGTHVVRITRPNTEPLQKTVVLAMDQRQTVVVPPPPVVATLVIQWPAEQLRDGQLSIDGESPITPGKLSDNGLEFTLKPGRHSVRITRPGFQPFEQTVELAATDHKPLLPVWMPELTAVSPISVATDVAATQRPATATAPVSQNDSSGDASPPGAKKLAVPSADDQKRIARQLEEIYKLAHSSAKDAKAKELYDVADKAKDTPAERYMLLTKGAELAAEAGDLALAFQGIDVVAAEYEIEPFDAKQKLLEKAVLPITTADQAMALITAGERLLDQAIDTDEYETAMSIAASVGKALSKRPVEMQLRKETEELLARRRRDIRMLEPLFAAFEKAQKVLKDKPADGEANSTVGRWYCFYKDNWSRGLPLLAKGNDEKLKSLAQMELKPPVDANEQIQLADGWWDLGQKETTATRDALRLHAGDLYTIALPQLNSALKKLAVERRLSEIANLHGPEVSVKPGETTAAFPLGRWVDVLRLVDPTRDAVSGTWSRNGATISCEPADYARLGLPITIDGSYDLEVEFTRADGNGDVNTLFPVGSHSCNVEISGGDPEVPGGRVSGLANVDGREAGQTGNPTTVRPGTLENDHRYKLIVSVRLRPGDQASVDVSLDGKPYLPHWAGNESSLTVNGAWALSDSKRPGFGTYQNRVVFHSVRLRMISRGASADAASAAGVQPRSNNKAPQLSGTYRVTNKQNRFYLAISASANYAGANALAWPDAGGADQLWTFVPLPDGTFKFENKNSGLPLAVPNGNKDVGMYIIQWNWGDVPDQHWLVEPASKGFVKLVNKNSGLCLSVHGDGKGVDQERYEKLDSQQWKLTPSVK